RLARPAAVANGAGNAVPAAFSYQTLWRQMALSIIAENDPEPERRELAKERMRELAILALPRCSDWRNWDQSLFDQPVDLDWRKQARVSLDKSPYGFVPHESWARLEKEQPLADALAAIYTVLLAGDRELAEPHAQDMEECLATARWQDVVGLHALAPAIGAHVRGVELELWDKTLYDSRREAPSSEMSFAAKFLEPDYDEKNPVKAGHRSTPPGKRRPEAQGGKGDPARRRRRKKRR
ncbi:MAG: hypothetical protein LIP23_07380, partial [Planctomycetes bacterium]|nr:hypothetical protein [Planctomycetota bacterium]